MKKIVVLLSLMLASQAGATWQSVLAKFETKENTLCKSERLMSESGLSSNPKPLFYKSYRINDIAFWNSTIMVLNALYNDNIRGDGKSTTEISEDIYYAYISAKDGVYYANFDKLSKYLIA
ncbi:hypothetical protein ACFFLM_06050 [Deinococcus oregonensis]|uniref:Uncharacterized protein n=1 Tax=Deinococcus oregonensis TaxID=1805970 RepID=A0ABV6AVK0_9DEIO